MYQHQSRKWIEEIVRELPKGERMGPHEVISEAKKRPHMETMTETGVRKLMPEMLRAGFIRNDVDGYYHRDSLSQKELAEAPFKELYGYARQFFDNYQHQRRTESQVVIKVMLKLLNERKAAYGRAHPRRIKLRR